MEKIARIILFICSMYKINLKSDSSGNISLVSEDKEYCINNISDLYKVQILKEYRPAGVDYDVIEPV